MEYTHFADDWEKVRDFIVLSKREFLASYSYLTDEEYELTLIEIAKRIASIKVNKVNKNVFKKDRNINTCEYEINIDESYKNIETNEGGIIMDMNANEVANWLINEDGEGATDEEFLEVFDLLFSHAKSFNKIMSVGEWIDICCTEIRNKE